MGLFRDTVRVRGRACVRPTVCMPDRPYVRACVRASTARASASIDHRYRSIELAIDAWVRSIIDAMMIGDSRRRRGRRRARVCDARARATMTTTTAPPSMPRWVCPGDVVLDAADAADAARRVTPGAGCAVCETSGAVRATVCGAPKCATMRDDDDDDDGAGAIVVVVERDGVEPVVPRVGDDVFGRVSRVDERQARVDVVAVNGRAPTGGDFVGVIRKQDVRMTEIDKVEVEGCFRAGDVVRAKVLSLGDARSFYLTTASDALGVVQARHRASREVMLPISWTEVQCPVTGEIEERKVAEITDS